METLLPLLTIIFIFFAAAIGRGLRDILRVKGMGPFEGLVVDASLGLGVISLVVFAFGMLRLYGSHTRYLMLAIVPVLGLPRAFVVWNDIKRIARDLPRCPSLLSILASVVLLILALAALIPALAPPSGSDWDSLAYHLAVPKLYLQHGRIYYINFTSHSNFPFLMEMLYTYMLAISGPVAAKMMHFWVGIILVASVAMLVRKHFSPKAAPLAAIALAGMPIIFWEATTAYIDLSTALYTIIAVHLLLRYLDKPEQLNEANQLGYLTTCAIAAGFAASTKMTALALIPLLALWLLIDRRASAKRSLEWKHAIILVATAFLICSPWYIKSLIYTGNPVYPFFYSIFGGRNWTSSLAHQYTTLQARFGIGHDFPAFVFLPYDLTFQPEKFYDTAGLAIGPIVLLAVPVLLALRRPSRKLLGLVIFFLAQLVLWFCLTQQSRYLIPSFAILAAIIAAIVYTDDRLKLARIALWSAFIAITAITLGIYYPTIRNTLPVVIRTESQENYLFRTLDIYRAEEWINESLPPGSKIAIYGDTRGFYLDRDYVWADPGHNTIFTRDFRSVSDYLAYLKSKHITHLMINRRRIGLPPKPGAKDITAVIYQAIVKGQLREVHPVDDECPAVVVYKLR